MMNKSLLLKGLAGVAAVGGVVGGGIAFQEQIKGVFSSSSNAGSAQPVAEVKKDKKSNLTHKELIDKAGLNCGFGEDETDVGETPKDCSVKEGGSITVKVGDQTEEGVTFTTSETSKLKVSKSEGESYSNKLKFVVDSGDINLTKKDGGGAATTIQKLEQFETYEIKEEEGGKYSLSRKTDSKVGKKNALGLGECELPDARANDRTCSYNTEKNIKEIKFEGHSEGISVTGEIGLKVSSTVDTTTFPYGYKFTFTFPGDLTINNKNLKAKIPYEFKIKKGTGNALTLEKAWADDNTFTKKAGLDCGTNKECSVSSTDPKLNVKVGEQKKVDITNITSGTGKIKMETEKEGYNQGLKFTIADGNVTFTDGSGDGITKLEELETYEITEEGGKYYLTKKTSPDELIKKTLALPDGCKLPGESSVQCTLSTDDFKKINFEGKGSEIASTGDVTLTISKANSTDFPFGYKFTFKSAKEATVTNENKIKANISTDYKIKKGGGSGTSVTLSLEKAWDDAKYTLAEKVGLKCTDSGTVTCCTNTDAGSVKLNVKKGNDKKEGIDSVTISGSSKIKVEKEQEGYNQGLKFTITGGDVTLSGGTSAAGTDFTTLEEFETYEITDEGGKYYLTRKTSKEDSIRSSLSIPPECFKTLGTSCTLTSDNFKAINFDGKSNPTSTGTVTLTISKGANTTDFPLGYKFSFNTTSDATIASENKIKANIPTDFKIKKNDSTLSLEKAWTSSTLGAKVGLKCCDDNTGDCTIDGTDGKKLRVKQLDKSDNESKQTSLTKNTSNSGSGKIKVTKDQAGYNQGFKFEIEGGSIGLSGSTGEDTIDNLGEYETYEIKEVGNEGWFLVIKDKADDFIKEQLGIKELCGSEKFPHSNSGTSYCNIDNLEKLKKIKFEGGTGHNWTGSVSGAQLEIKRATSLPGGFKFTFTGSSADVCLPTGTTGQKVKIKDNSSGVEYKIKKGSGTGRSATLTLERNGSTSGSGSCK